MRRKSPVLPLSTRQKIGEKKEKNPSLTYGDLAIMFHCSYDQARHAHLQYLGGRFKQTKQRTEPIKRDPTRDFDDLIKDQMLAAVQQLEQQDGRVTVIERAQVIERLLAAKKLLLQLSLAGHLRFRDAELISDIIRRFKPDADVEYIIKLVNEVRETSK